MKKLLRGGFVVTPRGSRRADVLLDGEKIAQVGHISPAEAKSAEVTDVSGCYLFPGFIDAHTHFDLDVCNTTTADDFASGTRSAIRGGTTTIIDFACPNKGETLAYGLDLWHKKADGKGSCDYGFHMPIDDWNKGIEGELDDMFAAGITSFKMYLTYPAMMIGDGAVYSALKALKKRGGIAGVHCENAGVIDARIAELKAAGRAADVSGCYLFPGFIDAHTHFDLDVCNTTTADDFASGNRSAIRGGTTTIIDFACPNKGETLAYGLDLWHKKADGKCSCDYGFHMTIDDWNEGIEGELDDMFAAGITSFKMYLTYPAMMIGDGAV